MAESGNSSCDERLNSAIAELQELILHHFPEATFCIESGIDDPEAIHLVATVDVEDRFDVLDLVSEHVMDIQIDAGIPIFVIPRRTPERIRAMLAAPHALPESLLVEDLT
jgi:hypothetical protein